MSEFNTEQILKTEYSKSFDEKRKGLVLQSYFKYGKASRNFKIGFGSMSIIMVANIALLWH